MTDAILLMALCIGCTLIGALIGMSYGYKAGTTDTERRWSESVSRANYARDLAQRVQS